MALAGAALLAALPGLAHDAATVKKTLQRLYDQEALATQRMSVAGMAADLDPSFISIGTHGEKRDYNYMIGNFNRMVEVAQSVAASSKIRSCTVHGDTAQVLVYSKVVVNFRQPGDKKPSQDIVLATTQDTWLYKGGHWRTVKSVDVEVNESLKGPAGSRPGSSFQFSQ